MVVENTINVKFEDFSRSDRRISKLEYDFVDLQISKSNKRRA